MKSVFATPRPVVLTRSVVVLMVYIIKGIYMKEIIMKLAQSPVMASDNDIENFVKIMELSEEHRQILQLGKAIIKKYYLNIKLDVKDEAIIRDALQLVSGNLLNTKEHNYFNESKISEKHNNKDLQGNTQSIMKSDLDFGAERFKNHINDKQFNSLIRWAEENHIDKKLLPRSRNELAYVTKLELTALNVSTIPPEVFNLLSLSELWLGYNQLKELSASIGDLKNLKKLSLSNNHITHLPPKITQLNNLKLLALDKNPLKLTKSHMEWLQALKTQGCLIAIDKDVYDLTTIVDKTEHNAEDKNKTLFNEALFSDEALNKVTSTNENKNNCQILFDEKESGIWAMDISLSKKLIAAAIGHNKEIVIFDLATQKVIKRISSSSIVNSIKFSPDDLCIAWVSGVRRMLYVADISNGNIIREQPLHRDDGDVKIDISKKGKFFVAAGHDGLLLEFFLGNFIFESYNDKFSSVVFTPDENNLLLGVKDGDILIFDVSNPTLLTQVSNRYAVELLSLRLETLLSNDSKDIYFHGHNAPVTSMVFSPCGNMLLSGDKKGKIILWHYKNRSILNLYIGHESPVTSISFSPDGKYFVSGSGIIHLRAGDTEDSSIKIWDINNSSFLGEVGKHDAAVSSVHFDTDTSVISSGIDGKAYRWMLDSYIKETYHSIKDNKNKHLLKIPNEWLLDTSTKI